MLKIIKILVCAFLLSLLVYPTKSIADPEIIISKPLTPQESISYYAHIYGAIEKELLTVAKCESRFNQDQINYNDGGKGKHSVGIFQYQYSTFLRMEKLFGEDLDYYSYNDQAKLTAFIFANYPRSKTEWTCYRMFYK